MHFIVITSILFPVQPWLECQYRPIINLTVPGSADRRDGSVDIRYRGTSLLAVVPTSWRGVVVEVVEVKVVVVEL